MKDNIFSLAFQGVRRKRKNSVLIFMVLFLSFSFAIATLSLLGSITKTNAEFRLNTYGEWCFAIPSERERDLQWLNSQSWTESVGTSYNFGTILVARPTGYGIVDESLKKMGRLQLESGVWPVTANEIAMEADVLGSLGYDYSLGQEITFRIAVPCSNLSVYVEHTYVLCGIIHEYTDLWQRSRDTNALLFNGAVVTEEAADQVLNEARQQIQEAVDESEKNIQIRNAVPQYFITVAVENREIAWKELQENLAKDCDVRPYENTLAYPDEVKKDSVATEPDRLYIGLIAVVAMLAVLCVYIMQLPNEAHSYVVLRSIGITKGQMAKLLLIESMMLCVPAILLGIPFGFGLTWLSLNLVMYAGSVPVQVEIPFGALYKVMLLWAAMIMFTRIIVYMVTVRVPMSGQMQLQRGKLRQTKILRNGFVVFLFSAFSGAIIFTALESIGPMHSMESWESLPPYAVTAKRGVQDDYDCIVQSQINFMEQIPGITNAVGYSAMDIAISFDGMEIGRSFWDDDASLLYLCAIDSADWEEIFDFGADREAFDRGEMVLLCFPDEQHPYHKKDGYDLPTGKIEVLAYDGYLYQNHGSGEPVDPKPPILFSSEPTVVSIQQIPWGVSNGWITFDMPYTVMCSNAFIEKMLANLEPGRVWKYFTAGKEVGFWSAKIYTDTNAEDLSTDKIMAQFCSRNNLILDNRREEFAARIQENFQRLILICAAGICIALMALLIGFSTLSLESEQERQYFTTMRLIGMSLEQMRMKIVGKALSRSIVALFAGWIFYFAYSIVRRIQIGWSFIKAVRGAVPRIQDILSTSWNSTFYAVVLSIICMLIPFILSLLAKCKLRKENMLS